MLHPFVRTFSYFNALRSFFFQAFGDHRSLPSFPTRRSSDLRVSLPEQSVTIGYECALPAASHRHLDPGRPMTRAPMFRLLFFFADWTASAAAGGSDLTIGIGADVTAIDPHYHNVTPNNNVAAHIFDYLVLRDERQRPIPGLAESWRTVDPLTGEFKLRKGVKFHDGSDFTAADVVASIERVPTVPNS